MNETQLQTLTRRLQEYAHVHAELPEWLADTVAQEFAKKIASELEKEAGVDIFPEQPQSAVADSNASESKTEHESSILEQNWGFKREGRLDGMVLDESGAPAPIYAFKPQIALLPELCRELRLHIRGKAPHEELFQILKRMGVDV